MSLMKTLGRKKSDEELICECSHPYHDHKRGFDEKTKTFSFACKGPCEKCDCPGYKEK